MSAEENFAQTRAGEETGLGAIELYFLDFLTALAFEFGRRECGFARQLVDKAKQRLGQLGEPGEGDGTVVGSRVGGEIGAEATEIFFDLAAGTLGSAGAHNGVGHFSEARCVLAGCSIARA